MRPDGYWLYGEKATGGGAVKSHRTEPPWSEQYTFLPGEFTGRTFELRLKSPLHQMYYATITAAVGSNALVRIDGDPHCNFPIITGPRTIRLSRPIADSDWCGVVLVVEVPEGMTVERL